jgi:D-aminoacyl-tRNA deacylase
VRAVIQRVSAAAVSVDGVEVAAIGGGFLMLVGVTAGDTSRDVEALVAKVSTLRVFPDRDQRMNRSISDVGGSVLVVSQFTLAADLRRGRRPSFTLAADPQDAEPIIEGVVSAFIERGIPAVSGVFGAAMEVSLVNDGPVTFVVDVAGGRVGQ